MLLGSVATGSDKPGFVEGHINIGPLTPVLHEKVRQSPAVSAEVYAALELAIFKADGKTKVTPLTPDKEGNFRQSLAPGTYVVAMRRVTLPKQTCPKPSRSFPIKPSRVDIEIDTGIR